MSVNISKQKRDVLISKIKELKDFITASPQDKNTQNLLGYLGDILKEINRKKYGLVFEAHQEGIDITLKSNLPILTKEEDLAIINGGELNFLIEGDNLASLQLLERTHKGKIDVIYIDPPYNTRRNDFAYNDTYVQPDDEYRHSKWLSFMYPRLSIAHNLLSDNGLIFISIDDTEQAPLKMLCDEIWGSENFVGGLIHQRAKGGGQAKHIVKGHDYILFYAKNINAELPLGRKKVVQGKITTIDGKDYIKDDDVVRKVFGRYNHEDGDRRCFYEELLKYKGAKKKQEIDEKIKNGELFLEENSYGMHTICRLIPVDTATSKIYSILKVLSEEGTKELLEIGITSFPYPKPKEIIKQLLESVTTLNKSATILDFFAGSGTTGQAVLELNKEDGGHRKFILCTNNENNICRDITYQRLKTVITGKRKDGSTYSDGLPGSLKYLKVGFIPVNDHMYYEYADQLLENIRTLVELENAVELNSNKSVSIIIDDEELEDFINSIEQHSECKSLYLGHDVLISSEQEQKLHKNGIEIKTVPEYYYPDTESRGGDEY